VTDDPELKLIELGKTLDRRVRCLLVYCAQCDLKVIRVECADDRGRQSMPSTFGALWTFGGLSVRGDGARDFTEYRPQATSLHRTFSWRCAHGHADTRRLDKFLRAWPQHDPGVKPPRLVRLKLGVDL
jgi:hypothetical protein